MTNSVEQSMQRLLIHFTMRVGALVVPDYFSMDLDAVISEPAPVDVDLLDFSVLQKDDEKILKNDETDETGKAITIQKDDNELSDPVYQPYYVQRNIHHGFSESIINQDGAWRWFYGIGYGSDSPLSFKGFCALNEIHPAVVKASILNNIEKTYLLLKFDLFNLNKRQITVQQYMEECFPMARYKIPMPDVEVQPVHVRQLDGSTQKM